LNELNKRNWVLFNFNFETDTKSIVQAHTVCTTQIDTNRHNRTVYNGCRRQNHRVTDTT